MMFLPNDSIEETKEFILRSQEGGKMISVAEIVLTVRKNFWRRGIATEAALALIQYVKEKLKVKK